MYTSHGHWYPPAIPRERPPSIVPTRCGGPARCVQCARETNPRAGTVQAAALQTALFAPAPPIPAVQPSDKPRLPIDAIADWYARYRQLKDAEALIETHLDETRSAILDYAKQSWGGEYPDTAELTVAGEPVLRRQLVSQSRVDTERLKAEQPELATHYTVTSQYEKLTII